MAQHVDIAGSGPAVAAVEAALSDVDATTSRVDPADVVDADLAVVVGATGDRSFRVVDDARTGRWLAVELGGIGGRSIDDVDAAVSLLGGEACFSCLATRVASNDPGARDGTNDPAVDVTEARLAGAIAGRVAVEVLAGDASPDRVIELPHVERRLLPAPNCGCGGERDRWPRMDDERVELDETAGRAEGAVDERLGIVAEVGEAESFPAPYYLATLCDTSAFGDGSAERHAAGVDRGWDAAFVKAIGEGLERYAAGIYRDEDFERATAAELDAPVPPSAFVLPENGFEPPDPDEPVDWVPGTDLADGSAVALPAEFVHFPPPDRRHKPAITTGLGLGTSGVGALLSGLYETIERDATTIAWYSTFEPVALDVESAAYDELARRARSEDLAVTPLLVTQDVDVPVVSVAVHRESTWPRFAVGSAADLDPAAAATGALCEALQNWMELRRMGRERAAEEESAIGRFADRPPEAEAFLDVAGTVSADGLASDADLSGEAELDAVLDRVADANLGAYASRLTTHDLEALGFEAVRVCVPAAQPRFLGERFFGERARRVPRELGYRPRFDRPRGPYP